MKRFLDDNFGNTYDRLSDNYLTKPIYENKLFEAKPLNPIFEPKLDLINKDINGYGIGDRTSVGFCPNPGPFDKQPGGMLPPNVNSLGQPMNNNFHHVNSGSGFAGVSQNGYFVPNADFMKPITSQPLNIDMPLHP